MLQRIIRAMCRTVMLLAAFGPLGIDVAGASTLPPPIEAIIAGYATQCHQLGGALVAGADRPQIITGDFDGDGVPDYVLNPQNLRCSAAATAFCGNGGCQIAIALSGNDYREPITVLGGQPTLVQSRAARSSRSGCMGRTATALTARKPAGRVILGSTERPPRPIN